uniref:Uncharacterized protein n=1 Tax=Anguilla anguilla TaxID=7936 RepID=A0A0E9PMU5_ANGAN
MPRTDFCVFTSMEFLALLLSWWVGFASL